MPTVTLSLKIYQNYHLKLVDDFLKSTFKGLNVKAEICGVTPRGLVQIKVSGEDEKAAINYLASKIEMCPTNLSQLEKFSTIKGRLTALSRIQDELYVDVGISSPTTIDAAISIQCLQTCLVDGRKMALKKIVEIFGLCENLPLTVKICNIDNEKNKIEATPSEKQLMQYRKWVKSLLDRLIILGASLHEVRLVLKTARCNRDVVDIEPLGLFEHAVVCKFGTDAVGLIPKIGKNLQTATFSIFQPRKIIEFLGDYFVL